MDKPDPMPLEEFERLLTEVEAGIHDELLVTLPITAEVRTPRKFAEVKEFDVLDWAARRGIKLPDR